MHVVLYGNERLTGNSVWPSEWLVLLRPQYLSLLFSKSNTPMTEPLNVQLLNPRALLRTAIYMLAIYT